VAEGNPCAGDAEDCFEEFEQEIRPSHEATPFVCESGALRLRLFFAVDLVECFGSDVA
jgi:hypothetical protein